MAGLFRLLNKQTLTVFGRNKQMIRLDKTRALRKIADLTGLSVMLNRDAQAYAAARCQVWTEKNGDYQLIASGRTWEAVINNIRKALSGK